MESQAQKLVAPVPGTHKSTSKRNGPYASWQDRRREVKGVGPP